MKDALKTAKNCRHYAMCKIDFLGTGLCNAHRGRKNIMSAFILRGGWISMRPWQRTESPLLKSVSRSPRAVTSAAGTDNIECPETMVNSAHFTNV